MNYMEAVFAPAEARYRAAVLADTWGHLAPKRNVIYRGHITFALGCFDSGDLNPTVLGFELNDRHGNGLDSSPWFYDTLGDFLQSFCRDGSTPGQCEEGGVYRWSGSFRNYKFSGELKRLSLED